MRKWITTPLLIEIAAAIFIILFLYTGISKLKSHSEFQVILAKSPLLASNALLISWLLPAVEIGVSILLFFPVTRKMGFVASTILMAIFTVYISYMLIFSPDLPCSCGGVLQALSWKQHLIFNLTFLLLGMLSLHYTSFTKLFIAINRKRRKPV